MVFAKKGALGFAFARAATVCACGKTRDQALARRSCLLPEWWCKNEPGLVSLLLLEGQSTRDWPRNLARPKLSLFGGRTRNRECSTATRRQHRFRPIGCRWGLLPRLATWRCRDPHRPRNYRRAESALQCRPGRW